MEASAECLKCNKLPCPEPSGTNGECSEISQEPTPPKCDNASFAVFRFFFGILIPRIVHAPVDVMKHRALGGFKGGSLGR